MIRTSRRGQALVEFALILPVLLIVLLGIIDGGRLIYEYNAVSNAAREGGRTAIINQTPAEVRAKAAQQATGLGLPTTDPGGCPTAGGPTSQARGICFVVRSRDDSAACSPATIGCTAVVSVKSEYRAITPIIGDLIGTVPVTSTTKQAIENACVSPDPCLTR